MNDTGAKQQIVEKIKGSSNILVTVSTNPSVDELSAALGLTLMLNKMNKHATAVFSGAIPPAITFLDPEKTFENTVDSLRDFIIALDKEKADHLRYKVDGDVVKIFITPYRTTITGDDLDFSQGDYNVELVLALGVKNQDSLDSALAAHGRILHDATVATISVGDTKSELGNLDWREETASSLSEVLVGLSESLKSDKPLLDEQIATAFLTGIVAATDRFSNNHTSSRVMTMAAQLMGAGANQQLIASKLEEAHEIGSDAIKQGGSDNENSDGTTDLSEGESTKLNKKQASAGKKAAKATEPKKDDGELAISHEKEGDVDEVAEKTAEEQQAAAAKAAEDELAKQTQAVSAQNQSEAAKTAEETLAEQLAQTAPAAAAGTPSVADLQADIAAANADVAEAATQPPTTSNDTPVFNGAVAPDTWKDGNGEPAMGGTLNATTEQAAEESRRAAEDDRNRTILSHGGAGYIADKNAPAYQSPLNSSTAPPEEPSIADPFQNVTASVNNDTNPTSYGPPVQPTETLAQLDEQTRAPHADARAAVDAAFNAAPQPAPQPFVAAPQPFNDPAVTAAPVGGMPPLPPLPDFSTLPPMPQPVEFNGPSGALPPEKLEDMFTPATPPPTAPASNDPAQFKIPGQS
jgi:hypothetical protein